MYYSITVDAKMVASRPRFEQFYALKHQMILIPFYPKISVKCFKRGTVSARIVGLVLALNILRNGFFLQVDTRFVYLH